MVAEEGHQKSRHQTREKKQMMAPGHGREAKLSSGSGENVRPFCLERSPNTALRVGRRSQRGT